MSNFCEMLCNGSKMAVQKNFKLLKYEDTYIYIYIYIYIYTYSFEARDLEILNTYLPLRNI